jgi:Transposase
VWLLNAAHMKAVPGRRSDVRDAVWIAQLLEHGLLAPSFVPPPQIRRLRMLTRYRMQLMGDRTREMVRLELMLEDTSIKLSSVGSTVGSSLKTVSARAMLTAMIDGEDQPGSARQFGERSDAAQDPGPRPSFDWNLRGSSCPAGQVDAAAAGVGRADSGRAGRGHCRGVPAVGASNRVVAGDSRGWGDGCAGHRRRDRRGHVPIPDPRAAGCLGRVGAGDA